MLKFPLLFSVPANRGQEASGFLSNIDLNYQHGFTRLGIFRVIAQKDYLQFFDNI